MCGKNCGKRKRFFSCGRLFRAIPHNSKCRYGERGAAAARPKAQIILDAAKVSAASGGNSEPKQGQRSQSARGFCPRSTMRVPQPDIIEHFGNADAVPQPPERCLSRKAGIVRCCLRFLHGGMRAYPALQHGCEQINNHFFTSSYTNILRRGAYGWQFSGSSGTLRTPFPTDSLKSSAPIPNC